MEGEPFQFESIGSRLGFRVLEESPDRLYLVWNGGRFPGLLCLGIALVLLALSIPVVEAIRVQGISSRIGSLWYFPIMNLILFGVSVFLLSLKRNIEVDHKAGKISLEKRSFFVRRKITVRFSEIVGMEAVTDQVYSGAGVAGSTVGQNFFPAHSLRLKLKSGQTILLERGGKSRIDQLKNKIVSRLSQTEDT